MDQVCFSANQFSAVASPSINMLKPAEGITLWALGALVTLKALANETGGSYSLFEDIVPPGMSPPTHVHTQEDETWYLVEGELEWNVGDQSFLATKGCFIHLPRNVPHAFINKSNKWAHMILTYAPGGFEKWFLDVGTPVADRDNPGQAPAPSPEGLKRAVILAEERYGVRFYGPGEKVKEAPEKLEGTL